MPERSLNDQVEMRVVLTVVARPDVHKITPVRRLRAVTPNSIIFSCDLCNIVKVTTSQVTAKSTTM